MNNAKIVHQISFYLFFTWAFPENFQEYEKALNLFNQYKICNLSKLADNFSRFFPEVYFLTLKGWLSDHDSLRK